MTRQDTPPADALYTADVAKLLDVAESTIKAYVRDAKRNIQRRRRGFPPPDGRALMPVASPSTPHQPTRSVYRPWWHAATISTFLEQDRTR